MLGFDWVDVARQLEAVYGGVARAAGREHESVDR